MKVGETNRILPFRKTASLLCLRSLITRQPPFGNPFLLLYFLHLFRSVFGSPKGRDRIDHQGANGHRHQRISDSGHGNVAQGKRQHGQGGGQVGPGYLTVGKFGNEERQSMVSSAGDSLPHDQTHAPAHETGSEYGGQNRTLAQIGQSEGNDFPEAQEDKF